MSRVISNSGYVLPFNMCNDLSTIPTLWARIVHFLLSHDVILFSTARYADSMSLSWRIVSPESGCFIFNSSRFVLALVYRDSSWLL